MSLIKADKIPAKISKYFSHLQEKLTYLQDVANFSIYFGLFFESPLLLINDNTLVSRNL